MRVMSDRTRANDYSIPVPDWWPRAVERELGSRQPPMQKQQLAQAVGLEKHDISRCLHGQAVLGPVQAISDFLKIPRPVAIFETEESALAYHGFLVLRGLDAQMAAVLPRGSTPTPDGKGSGGGAVQQSGATRRRTRSGRAR
jgi:hypothetical protein